MEREWVEKDYYGVLGVSKDADQATITKTYRKLARQFHPDANPGDAKAEDRFKDISAAYDVIGDEAKRKEYDQVRAMGPMGGFGGAGGGPGGFRFDPGGADIGDLLGGMFGGGGGRRRNSGAGPQKGGDLEAELTLSFLDAANGITTSLSLVSDAQCTTCVGSGARPGTSPRLCQTCGGRGSVADNQGPFSFWSPCGTCRGRGRIIDHPCQTCSGSGVERRPRDVKVRIPAGVDDGQRIRLPERGQPGRNGGPPGDLFVICKVKPHELFGRDGLNLTLRVPVLFSEAALGHEVRIPLLDGSSSTLRLVAGTQPGTRMRVKGKGLANSKATGDLIVTVDVLVPSQLSKSERKAIEELAKVSDHSLRSHLGVN
jgi:molecular chaperone DnaJ